MLEAELLLEIKRMNASVDQRQRPLVTDQYVEAEGLKFSRKSGAASGNRSEVIVIASVGGSYPADVMVRQRIKNSSLAERTETEFGCLPSVVPGVHKEAAADLMCTVSTQMRSSDRSVVQLLLDVPFLQRSKNYYLQKIETFLQNCKEPVGMSLYDDTVITL